jgi:hypothetical protein
MESARRRAEHRAIAAHTVGSRPPGGSGVWPFLLLAVVSAAGVAMILMSSVGSAPAHTSSNTPAAHRQVFEGRPVLAAMPTEGLTGTSGFATAEPNDHSSSGDIASAGFDSAIHAFTTGTTQSAELPLHALNSDARAAASPAMFAGLTAMATGNELSGAFTTDSSALTVAPVPEPSTWALLIASALGLAARRVLKRRRISE